MVLLLLARRLRDGRLPGGRLPGGRLPGSWGIFRQAPPADMTEIPFAIQAVRFIVLVTVVVTVPLSKPSFGTGPAGVATAVALGVSAAAWITWLLARGRPRLWLTALVVMAAAGGALAGLSSLSTAVAVGMVVTASAGSRLPTETSLAITAETVAAFLAAGLATGAPAEALVGWSASFVGMWAFGLTRRAYVLRAEEAEQALENARRAHTAETQAAALAERARIAREIHDVLAHSLATVSVNLQAAEGLLAAVPDGSPELAKAIECVERAGAFTKEGMAEARRAVRALRDDPSPVSATPVSERLRALAGEHHAVGDTTVGFTVTGQPRPVDAETGLAVYRAAQEALTNARKHAPGQPVTLTLEFNPDDVTVRVSNPLPADDTTRPLAHAGAGYGLTGLRERAALGGGTLTAGPAGGQWHVCLRIPA